ncbi:MAG: GTPase HflX, partial [Muribaculaceae bacterium]|nr:GTPase HflX [Muribaculaceae bacterium]
NIPLEELEQTWMSRLSPGNCVFVSARTGANIDALKKLIYDKARQIHAERFPYNDFLYQTYDDVSGD